MDFEGNINGREFLTTLAGAPTAAAMAADFPEVEESFRFRGVGNRLVKRQEINENFKDFNRFIEILRGVLQNVDSDNFNLVEIEGTTSGSADARRLFKHNKNSVPQFVWPLEGDVYIAKEGRGDKDIDIRSRRTNESFKLLLIF